MNISVVIPHYGSAEPTASLVAQLRGQSMASRLQIIVCDDASPEPYEGDADSVVRRSGNGGFGTAVNTGAACAQHDMLLILNSDIMVTSTFVEELADGARAWMPAIVTTQVHEPWGVRCVGHTWPTMVGLTAEMLDPLARLHGTRWFETLMGNDLATMSPAGPVLTEWATGVCLMMPTSDFWAVGGFDEAFFMNCEEVDLQRRLSSRGLPVVVLPAPVVEHIGGGSSDPRRRLGWLFDSRMRYHEKWHRAAPLYAATRLAAAVNLVWNAARRAAGRDIEPLRKYTNERDTLRHAWRNRR